MSQSAMPQLNALASEKSPYLKQHRGNPVYWYPWCSEAFQASRERDRPIFLSIGYSSCYWCHVMEKDSFERQEVADVLNKHFISVKVDREERPDVDAIYMDAVVAMTGQGGWPMSVFLTPHLKPFWGGTFFYRQQFLEILDAIQRAWDKDRQKILESSEHLTNILFNTQSSANAECIEGERLLGKAIEAYSSSYDSLHGGFGTAPKFPAAQQASLLLNVAQLPQFRESASFISEMAFSTLEKMARGGIYDHLGGGFHRYSTDSQWLTPHFEKMLYDNALLSFSYLEAFQFSGKKIFARVAEETLDYLIRDMRHPQGGFYSALDAGEVGKEGEYYVWKHSELEAVLNTMELELLKKVFPLSEQGNFEGANILNFPAPTDWEQKYSRDLRPVIDKILAVRGQRHAPGLDNKVLCSWNGLLISALCKAYQVLDEKRYLQCAIDCAAFIESSMFKGTLYHSLCEGELGAGACLDDYAYFIEGLLQLYESTLDISHFSLALKLQAQQDQLFWNKEQGAYVYSAAKDLITHKIDLYDNATPAGNSTAALNLLRLEAYTADSGYKQKAYDIFKTASTLALNHTQAFPKLLSAICFSLAEKLQIVLLEGRDDSFESFQKVVYGIYLPNKVLAGRRRAALSMELPLLARTQPEVTDKSCIYICRGTACGPAIYEAQQAKTLLESS